MNTVSTSDFGGVIGRTVAESKPQWTSPSPADGRPNVLVVILDDTGWSDFGCFGSRINTPSIDGISSRGLRYTNFHVTPLCSPTRASFLTARNPHRVGMRFLANADTGFPNGRGQVPTSATMLPGILRQTGYATYMVGKWHLTPHHEMTPAGPFGNWPLARGFDRFYGFLSSCTDQYHPDLYMDNHQIDGNFGPDYHLSSDLADRSIRYLKDHSVFRQNTPFYLQLAFAATHAPFQVDRSFVDKYLDTSRIGWDRERELRLLRQIELGLVPPTTQLTDRNAGVPAWDDLPPEVQRLYAHQQAAYAGFLEHTDQQLGRVIDTLQELGQLENTIIVLFSDNGASGEGYTNGAVNVNGAYSGIPQTIESQLEQLNLIGGKEGPAHYTEGWAMAGNTPFRRYKQFVDLGGVRSPLLISWPKGISARQEIRSQFVHVVDLAPTILELTSNPVAENADGASIVPTFSGSSVPAPKKTQYWEMLGQRAIWHEGWRAVSDHTAGTSYEDDAWRLYDTVHDFAEQHDIADLRPDLLKDLRSLWWREAEKNEVFPLDDRPLLELYSLPSPMRLSNRKQIILWPGMSTIPVESGLAGLGRTVSVLSILTGLEGNEEGVLLSSGSAQGGYVLYIKHRRLIFEHHALGCHSIVTGDSEIGAGDVQLGFLFDHAGGQQGGRVNLIQNGASVGMGDLQITLSHPSFWGINVGRAGPSPVSRECPTLGAFPRVKFKCAYMDYANERYDFDMELRKE